MHARTNLWRRQVFAKGDVQKTPEHFGTKRFQFYGGGGVLCVIKRFVLKRIQWIHNYLDLTPDFLKHVAG